MARRIAVLGVLDQEHDKTSYDARHRVDYKLRHHAEFEGAMHDIGAANPAALSREAYRPRSKSTR
jgi:hypothetical protein